MTGSDVVRVAREIVGTAFHHQGRLKGVGIDCAGVVIVVAHELGLSEFDVTDYGRIPDGETIRSLLDEHMDPVEKPEPGDVLLFRFTKHDQHLAILATHDQVMTIIHARGDIGRVVETSLDKVWKRRVTGAWRYRGLA